MSDLFGLGWRPPLAAHILRHLDRIDVVEVMIEDYLHAGRTAWGAIKTLSSNVPVVMHGLSLGLGSTVPVDGARLQAVARLVDEVRPQFWSEHLAFVRAGDIEAGHLLAPPRNDRTVAAAVDNIREATRVVGSAPMMENIATLMLPPGSTMDEATWVRRIITEADCDLLLDLHNVYANCVNFGGDPFAFIRSLPPSRIAAIHLAGGKWILEPAIDKGPATHRLLDDHLHPVPNTVYALLAEVGALTPRSLTVMLEYDGAYPPIEELIEQLDQARAALGAGRRSAVRARTQAV